ncbi:MAG: RNA polymerase sigma factor [Bacteroidota bacterium]
MNHSEFIRLGAPHVDAFYALALRLTKNREAAQDLVQEAAFLAVKHWNSFQANTNFRAWIMTIIRNTFFSACRRDQRRRELLLESSGKLGWSGEKVTYNPAESQLGVEEIMRLVNALPEHYRTAFLLHYRGLKYREIADRVGAPVGTIKSRVSTARSILREQLTKLNRDVA